MANSSNRLTVLFALTIVGIKCFKEYETSGSEAVLVYVFHVIAESMPIGEEVTAGSVLHDIDHRDASHTVNIIVVVKDGVGVLVYKNVAVADS